MTSTANIKNILSNERLVPRKIGEKYHDWCTLPEAIVQSFILPSLETKDVHTLHTLSTQYKKLTHDTLVSAKWWETQGKPQMTANEKKQVDSIFNIRLPF
jgi:DUF438 domain-containing protein